MKIGIIAEDDSDVEVISEITLALLKTKAVGFKRFIGGGCGKVARKCAAWARILVQQGCASIIVVHDLDTNDERQLRHDLTAAVAPANATHSVVLIPKREIEAWLLYDAAAIAAAFRETKHPKVPGDPESLPDPKRYLGDLIWRKYHKKYLNTIHNAQIARRINVSRLRQSPSFAPHITFTSGVRQTLPRGAR